MNYLSSLYKDSMYGDLLDHNPFLSIAIVGNRASVIYESIVQHEDRSVHFNAMCVPDVRSLLSTKATREDTSADDGILKSNWCSKHLHSRFSCIVYEFDWDGIITSGMSGAQLCSICNELTEYVRSYRSKVVFILVTERARAAVDNPEDAMEKLRQEIKSHFDGAFEGVLPLYALGREQESAAHLAQTLEMLAMGYHTEELIRISGKNPPSDVKTVRCMFKKGWHCLVLKDAKAAVKSFRAGYDTLRETTSLFPAMEARVCATLFLRHLLHAAKEMTGILYDESYYRLCEEHIIWLGRASHPCAGENNSAAFFLRSLLIAECAEWLAHNTTDIPSSALAALLTTCLLAYKDALGIKGSVSRSEQNITPPSFLGVECRLKPHGDLFSSRAASEFVMKRVRELVASLSALTALSGEALHICARMSLLLNDPEGALSALQRLWELNAGSYRVAEACHDVLCRASVLASAGTQSKWDEEMVCSYLSLVFGPAPREKQGFYANCFRDMLKQVELHDIRLVYPRRGHFAPFTVLCRFSSDQSDSSTQPQLYLTFFSAAVELFTVDSISVTISHSQGDAEPILSSRAPAPDTVELSSQSPCVTTMPLELNGHGLYRCVSVRGRVTYAGVSLVVEWQFEGSGAQISETPLQDAFSQCPLFSAHKPYIHIVKPLCHVEITVPNCPTGIEGEIVSAEIVVRTDVELTGRGSIALTHISNVCEVVGDAFRESSVSHRNAAKVGTRSFLVDAPSTLSPALPFRVPVKFKLVRAGKYTLPVSLSYESANFSNVEVVQRMEVHVLYPFSPTFTVMKSLPLELKGEEDKPQLEANKVVGPFSALSVPEASCAFVHGEHHKLVHPREYLNDDMTALQGKKNILFYNTYTETKSCADLNISNGENIVLIATMKCQALFGVELLSLNAAVSNGATLLSLTAGSLPCHVGYLESLTVVARFRVSKTGKFPLGFLRLLISPGGGTQRVVSDMSLPEVVVDDNPLALTLTCPSTAVVGMPLLISCKVVNKTETAQHCVLEIENKEESVVCAATHWSFSMEPHSVYNTQLTLQPLVAGVLHLPSIHLRHASGIIFGTVASCQSDSQRICVLPF
uniref:Trafficking protein particle complex subunit 11 domain-containing protein n=1 Tax=Trypanosoma vivax (strain Y486) TaxID=1055687 RepID=G0U0T2_TRYVY|nr:conserved hypothetical protein [Trypanosoma vivax Y486]